ncbi:hypothetical protein H311_01760, partial [Anncaliia algerae PRA109]
MNFILYFFMRESAASTTYNDYLHSLNTEKLKVRFLNDLSYIENNLYVYYIHLKFSECNYCSICSAYNMEMNCISTSQCSENINNIEYSTKKIINEFKNEIIIKIKNIIKNKNIFNIIIFNNKELRNTFNNLFKSLSLFINEYEVFVKLFKKNNDNFIIDVENIVINIFKKILEIKRNKIIDDSYLDSLKILESESYYNKIQHIKNNRIFRYERMKDFYKDDKTFLNLFYQNNLKINRKTRIYEVNF